MIAFTGEPYTDAQLLLESSDAERAEGYCELQDWPKAHRDKVLDLFDEVWTAEIARKRGAR
ncbi:MAG: hypothetical protein C0P74_013940 [Gammaproteobacteria bacterium]